MTLRRYAVLGASLFAALSVLCGAALAATYPDRVGDVKAGTGPDLVSVAVFNTKANVTFRLRFAKAPPLRVSQREGWVDMLLIGVDVPPLGPRPTTPGGEWRGANFALGVHGPSKTGQMVRVGQGEYRRVATFKIVTSGPTLAFSVARRAFGSPAWFVFTVAAAREQAQEGQGGGVDVAPAGGTFRYVLTG